MKVLYALIVSTASVGWLIFALSFFSNSGYLFFGDSRPNITPFINFNLFFVLPALGLFAFALSSIHLGAFLMKKDTNEFKKFIRITSISLWIFIGLVVLRYISIEKYGEVFPRFPMPKGALINTFFVLSLIFFGWVGYKCHLLVTQGSTQPLSPKMLSKIESHYPKCTRMITKTLDLALLLFIVACLIFTFPFFLALIAMTFFFPFL